MLETRTDRSSENPLARVDQALTEARRSHWENPGGALAEAIRCYEIARALECHALCARALALQGAVSSHRGDLEGALELVVAAERHWKDDGDPVAACEIGALKAQLNFFTGAYSEALRHAEAAIAAADRVGDLDLRVHARRTTCMVFGNIGVADLRERIEQLLEMSVEAGDPWEQAISHNDLACYLQETGDHAGAEREIELGLQQAAAVHSESRFVEAILHSTKADVMLGAERPSEALAAAEHAIALLASQPDPNPYILGATVRAEVQARMALGNLEDAKRAGEGALAWLGDRVPQMRSLILSTLAGALREAGKLEAAYDALARAAELERQAFRELSGLQLRLERARLEASAARHESDQLAASNRRLAQAHEELARRAAQLEGLQEQLHDQANRDWLTGLYNRRYLAAELARIGHEGLDGPFSVAVLDIDRFKSINDRFGHATGDQVMAGVGQLLSAAVRGSDVVVRSGGEEFVLLMPFTDLDAATACCRRICDTIRGHSWTTPAGKLRVTASVGVATSTDAKELDAVMKLADHRLYDAKQAGRDLVNSVAAGARG